MTESMATRTPREVFLESLELQFLPPDERHRQADLFAEDSIFEFPFVLQDKPMRFEGRETIRTFFAERGFDPEGMRLDAHEDVVIWETIDPEVVITSYVARVTAMQTGVTHRLPCIKVLRVRNGEFVLYQDYVNALAASRATGAFPAVVKMLAAELSQ